MTPIAHLCEEIRALKKSLNEKQDLLSYANEDLKNEKLKMELFLTLIKQEKKIPAKLHNDVILPIFERVKKFKN